jgi:hypothetical protein
MIAPSCLVWFSNLNLNRKGVFFQPLLLLLFLTVSSKEEFHFFLMLTSAVLPLPGATGGGFTASQFCLRFSCFVFGLPFFVV